MVNDIVVEYEISAFALRLLNLVMYKFSCQMFFTRYSP